MNTPHIPDRLHWRTSSHTGAQNNCVEVADMPASLAPAVAVRDSKDPDGPLLCLSPSAWRQLLAAARDTSR
ncbi:DUF397 domain-containing protein [Actinomadura viridis]|uniref:DUF397 domain-containing protein n=1 Tax=Actinomadura viridis TaxID=58110 RepID=UPI0036C01D93